MTLRRSFDFVVERVGLEDEAGRSRRTGTHDSDRSQEGMMGGGAMEWSWQMDNDPNDVIEDCLSFGGGENRGVERGDLSRTRKGRQRKCAWWATRREWSQGAERVMARAWRRMSSGLVRQE